MNSAIDPKVEIIAKRIITNGQWASLYLGYFEASNRFLRSNSRRLDDDARDMLNVLVRGLPRLSALCLCRLWDMPGKDRHSLPALIKIAAFTSLANARDPSFIRDCSKLIHGKIIVDLRKFRIVDLAHNLPIDGANGFTSKQLRKILRVTQAVINRLVNILERADGPQKAIFKSKEMSCKQFWQTVAPKIVYSKKQQS